MAKKSTPSHSSELPPKQSAFLDEGEVLTTNQGLAISDNHNSLKQGPRGPTLLEDFVLREKITSFDHERIPERIVHARGAGAFGFFECTVDMSKYTSAGLFTKVGKRTPVLTRFSTVAGSRGSMDTARDVRGFSTKFYTDEGNYDLVGNNMPVFFIQDAMKFPDLIHAVKPEQDNEIPQAQSAHDTFWDFISLMPESTHMVTWLMSDRAIPRSYRMMEGFGVHTFRLVNRNGKGTFVKIHWKPALGVQSIPWEESQQLGGLDPDYHRRDLFEAIEAGKFPEWELGLQLIPEADEFKFPFDLLDPTKLVPEEMVPVQKVGRLVLNRNPENYFAEIEQVAFHPGNLVPGVDLSNDPLLQGRLFSYTDTQLTRLGGPNFHQIPVNRPLAPVSNNNRDGLHQQMIPKGKAAYEPSSVPGGSPLHAGTSAKTFVSFNEKISAQKVRARSSSFGDHFSQAKLFYDSQTEIEKIHIKNAFSFELSKVKTAAVRNRMCETLLFVNQELAMEVAQNVGASLPATPSEQPNPADSSNNIVPKNPSLAAALSDDVTINSKMKLPAISKALSIVANNPKDPQTRLIAFLVGNETPADSVDRVRSALSKYGIRSENVIPHFSQHQDNNDLNHVEQAISSTPSHRYDGVFVFTTAADYISSKDLGCALRFIGQAFKHCKTIGGTDEGEELIGQATLELHRGAVGVVIGAEPATAKSFAAAVGENRHWGREELVEALPF